MSHSMDFLGVVALFILINLSGNNTYNWILIIEYENNIDVQKFDKIYDNIL